MNKVPKFTTIAILPEDKKFFQTVVAKECLKHHLEYQYIGMPDYVQFKLVCQYYVKKWGDE